MKRIFIPLLLAIFCGLFIFVVTTVFLYLYFPLELKTYDLRVFLRTKKYDFDNLIIVEIGRAHV